VDTPTTAGSLTVPTVPGATDLEIDPDLATALALSGFEWAIPALVLTVPGIVLVLAILAQAIIGVLWVPVTRRWVGGDRRLPRPVHVAAG
jgi:hypothetical protein